MAKAFAAAAAVKESEIGEMEAAVAAARREQARAVTEADSRAAISELQSDETHALRIKATRLTAQVEVLQRREEQLLQESRLVSQPGEQAGRQWVSDAESNKSIHNAQTMFFFQLC